jgi:hypothetical protein
VSLIISTLTVGLVLAIDAAALTYTLPTRPIKRVLLRTLLNVCGADIINGIDATTRGSSEAVMLMVSSLDFFYQVLLKQMIMLGHLCGDIWISTGVYTPEP